MLSAAPHCFVVLLAVQLVQGSPQHSGTEEEHSISEGFSNHTTCSWNCRVTESDFTKQCDPVFTKKRLITFNVLYDLEVNKKCFNQTSYKSLFTDNFNVSTPANITLSSFSRGIKGVWTLTWIVSCYEEGQIKGFCHFEPRSITILRPRDFRKEVKESIEEMAGATLYLQHRKFSRHWFQVTLYLSSCWGFFVRTISQPYFVFSLPHLSWKMAFDILS